MKGDTTRRTLLMRVKDREDASAWAEFYELYSPLLYRYSRSKGLSEADAEEIRDQCFEVLSRRMGAFDYDESRGGFKNWLYRIVHGKVIDHLRRKKEVRADTVRLMDLQSGQPQPDEVWENHWADEHLKFCLERARREVRECDFRAFERLLFREETVPQVCEALGMNPNQVYKAKMKVLQKLRSLMQRFDVEADGILKNPEPESP